MCAIRILNRDSLYGKRWTQPHLVTYMESHDEERMMYKNLQFGNHRHYNTKDIYTALNRVEMCAAFFTMIPGPKMIWEFGSLVMITPSIIVQMEL